MVLMYSKVAASRPRTWINDSFPSRVLCQFRASDIGLGNRAPLVDGTKNKLCVLCRRENMSFMNNEVHILTQCTVLTETRDTCGITAYMDYQQKRRPHITNVKLARLFLGGDGAPSGELLKRASQLCILLKSWEESRGIASNCTSKY